MARGAGYNLFLTSDETVIALEKANAHDPGVVEGLPDVVAGISKSLDKTNHSPVRTLRMKLEGANQKPRVTAKDKLASKSNYFTGSDPRKWRTGIPNYSQVRYEQVYKGIDVVYYGNQRQLEYDFIVSPGADPGKINMSFAGADEVKLSEDGDLIIQADGREVRMKAPVTYQEKNGVNHEVASRYVINAGSELPNVGFQVGEYDEDEPLVIDPVLVYSTYLGGSGADESTSITVDSAGNAYVIGFTDSTNFPLTGALQTSYGGNPQDIFVSKLNAAGTGLVYSTYIGGSGQDNGSDIAVDAGGNAYITGYSASTNFPTVGPLQATRTGFANVFAAKLNPTGSQLIYSTYLGGSVGDFGSAIAVDSNGNAYIGGVTSSPDFPQLNPVQANYGGNLADAFVTKLNPAGSQILYSTLLGGNGNDGVNGIAIDTAGNAYISGVTFSTNFPTKNPLQTNFSGGGFDAFLSKLSPSGSSLVYSTYLGGNDDDRGYRVALDTAGNVYIAGQTLSSNFPTVSALQPIFGGRQ